MEVQDELEALTGVVDNIIFASPEGSFCVFRLLPEGQKSTVTEIPYFISVDGFCFIYYQSSSGFVSLSSA